MIQRFRSIEREIKISCIISIQNGCVYVPRMGRKAEKIIFRYLNERSSPAQAENLIFTPFHTHQREVIPVFV